MAADWLGPGSVARIDEALSCWKPACCCSPAALRRRPAGAWPPSRCGREYLKIQVCSRQYAAKKRHVSRLMNGEGPSSCQRSPSITSWSCPGSPSPRPRRTGPWSRSPPRRPATRARGSRSAARSPGVDLRRPRPVHPHGPDGRGRLRPGRAQGHAWHPHRGFETVTYMIDGTFRAPGLQRRRRPDHQRRHPVDDRGRRHPAHRGAAGGARGQRRPVPRLPALGQPARAAEDDRPALPGHPGRAGRAAVLAGRRRAAAGHRRRASAATPAPASRTRRSRWCTPRWRPARRLRLPWRPDFNALVYVLAGTGTVGAEPTPGPARASWPCSAPATSITFARRRRARTGRSPSMDVLHPRRRADPRAGRRLRAVRHEHPGRAGAGVRGLPGRPAGQHPGRADRVPPDRPPRPRRPLTDRLPGWRRPPTGYPGGGVPSAGHPGHDVLWPAHPGEARSRLHLPGLFVPAAPTRPR